MRAGWEAMDEVDDVDDVDKNRVSTSSTPSTWSMGLERKARAPRRKLTTSRQKEKDDDEGQQGQEFDEGKAKNDEKTNRVG